MCCASDKVNPWFHLIFIVWVCDRVSVLIFVIKVAAVVVTVVVPVVARVVAVAVSSLFLVSAVCWSLLSLSPLLSSFVPIVVVVVFVAVIVGVVVAVAVVAVVVVVVVVAGAVAIGHCMGNSHQKTS